jgi:hypothetical protein
VTGIVEPGRQYLLAESTVPGYKQITYPAVPKLAPGATGSWRCVENLSEGRSGLEDFTGGSGVVVVEPGEPATCTAVNRLTRAIPVGAVRTGGGFARVNLSAPMTAGGLALMAAGALLGLGGLRMRRSARPGA